MSNKTPWHHQKPLWHQPLSHQHHQPFPHTSTLLRLCVCVPGSLVSRQVSCLLASGVQDRSREDGCRLMIPARDWLERGLQRLTSILVHRRLSQLLQERERERDEEGREEQPETERSVSGWDLTHLSAPQRPVPTNTVRPLIVCVCVFVPLVPGLADSHTVEQLGSVQKPEHWHPHLLLPSSIVSYILEGREREQGGGRERGGGGRSLLFLWWRPRAASCASVSVTSPQTRPVASDTEDNDS